MNSASDDIGNQWVHKQNRNTGIGTSKGSTSKDGEQICTSEIEVQALSLCTTDGNTIIT